MRYSRNMKYLAIILCLLTSWPQLRADSKPPAIEIKTESQALEGKASLLLRCNVRNASVSLNKISQGNLPRDILGLQPGSYSVIISAEGYFDQSLELSLAANTKTTVTVELIPKLGYLYIRSNVKNTIVQRGRQVFEAGLVQLPAGPQTLTIKAFGYEEKTIEVLVPLNLIHQIEVELQPASFRTTSPSISRTSFNPRNAGLLGSISLHYDVSAAGQAEYLVFDATGTQILYQESRVFDDWQQSWFWNGRDATGLALPDGSYRMEVRIRPADDVPSQRLLYSYDFDIDIDSTMLVLPQGMARAIPGPASGHSSFLPASSSLYWGGGFLLLIQDDNPAQLQAGMKLGLSIKDTLDIGLQLHIGTESGSLVMESAVRSGFAPIGWFSPGAALSVRIPADSLRIPLQTRLALPLGLGTRFINLNLAPEIALNYTSSWYWTGSGSLSLNLSTYSFGVQVSSRLTSSPLGQGPLAVNMPIPLALDINLMPANFPLRINLNSTLFFGQTTTNWQAGLYFEVDIF